MNLHIKPGVINKFVIVETKEKISLWADSTVKWHKESVAKKKPEGISVLSVKGGGRIKYCIWRIFF